MRRNPEPEFDADEMDELLTELRSWAASHPAPGEPFMAFMGRVLTPVEFLMEVESGTRIGNAFLSFLLEHSRRTDEAPWKLLQRAVEAPAIMRSVLILFTCYDRPSYYTAQWGRAAQDLVQRKDTVCLSYDAGVFCRNSTGLADTIGRVDYVVFYGHGTQDEWTALPELPGAQPPVPSIPLVETGTVRDLQEKKVYAGCCWSLKGLGQAYVATFLRALSGTTRSSISISQTNSISARS